MVFDCGLYGNTYPDTWLDNSGPRPSRDGSYKYYSRMFLSYNQIKEKEVMVKVIGFFIAIFTFVIALGFFSLAASSLITNYQHAMIFGGIAVLVVAFGVFIYSKIKG